MSEKTVWVESLFGGRTKEPIVALSIDREKVQMRPEIARQIARQLIEAAESATTDAFMWQFIKDICKGDERAAVVILDDFRQFREAQRERELKIEEPEG